MPDVATERLRSEAAEQRTNGGPLLARTLREQGVTTVFALAGGHILPFLDACLDERIRVIDTRHEGPAVLAAEGWALATGETGVATVTAGPGFANGLIGLLDAAAWSVPLVMLSGRTGHSRQGRGAVMDIDQRAVAAPLAKWSATCSDAGRVPRYVAEALHRARSGCPGAVYLEVDADAMYRPAAPLDVWTPGFASTPSRPSGVHRGRRRRGCRARDRGAPGHRRRERRLLVGRRRCDRAVRRAGPDPGDHRKCGSRDRPRHAPVEPRFAGARRPRHPERRLRPGARLRLQRQRDVRRRATLRHRPDDDPGRHRRGACRRESIRRRRRHRGHRVGGA